MNQAAFPVSSAGDSWYWNDAGTNGNSYFVAWKTYGSGIKGQLLDKNGGKIGSALTVVSSGDGPCVASDGNKYLVVYTDSQYSIFGKFVESDGSVGPQISIGPGSYPNTTYDPDVTYNGEKFLVVWAQFQPNGGNSQVWGRFVDSSGALGQKFRIGNPARNNQHPFVTYGNGQFFVAWTSETSLNSGNRDVYGARVDLQGNVLDTPDIPLCTKSGGQDLGGWMHGGIMYDGVNYVVMWRDYSGYPSKLVAARISNNGLLLDGAPETSGKVIPLLNYGSTGSQIVYDGVSILAVGDAHPMAGIRLDRELNAIDTTPIIISNTDTKNPSLVFGGNNFLVTWDNAKQVTGSGDTLMGQILVYDEQPVAIAGSTQTVAPGSSVVLNGTASYDPDGNLPLTYTWSFVSRPSGSSAVLANPNSPTPGFVADKAGNYTVKLVVKDSLSAASTPVTSLIIAAIQTNQPPVISPIEPKTVDENQVLSFAISASDPDSDPLAYTTSTLPDGAMFDPVTKKFTWTPGFDQAGSYPITFTVTAAGMSVSQTVQITVNNVNRPPFLDTIESKSVNEGDTLTFTVSATQPDNLPVSVIFSPVPPGAQISGTTFTWTPTYDQAGSYPLTFTATAAGLSVNQPVTIIVINVNRNPVAEAGTTKTVIVQEPAVFDGSLSKDPEGSITSYTWNFGDGSSGYGVSPTHSFGTSGTFTITLTVTDNEGATGTDTTTVIVKSPSQAVQDVITPIKSMNLQKGTENSLTSKLDNAVKSLDKGNANAAKNQLEAAIKEITSQNGKNISGEQANTLISALQKIVKYL